MNAHHQKTIDPNPERVSSASFNQDEAELAAVSAYLNAMLREWQGWRICPATEIGITSSADDFIEMPLVGGSRLYIAVTGCTISRQTYRLPFYIKGTDGSFLCLNVTEAITQLVMDPVISPGQPDLQKLLLKRILDSMLASQQAEAEDPRLPEDPSAWNFQQAEQALTHGHHTHPNPRSRDEMGPDEARKYAPELGGRYPLFWSLIHKDLLSLETGTEISVPDMCQAMVTADESLLDLQKATSNQPDFLPVPWHPWQAGKLLAKPDILDAIRQCRFIPFGERGQPFAATASFRGAQAFHSPYMLKFSLSLRLTNSTRILARKEVERGVQLASLLAGEFGTVLSSEFPDVSILKEPGFAALKGEGDLVQEDSFVVFRDNPFRDPSGSGPIALASLCEFKAAGHCPLRILVRKLAAQEAKEIEVVAAQWLRAFMRVAILPVLEIRARHGLLFGAHQQNMMIQLAEGYPAKLWLRDCQGTGHLTTHHDHLETFLPDIGANAENVVPPELGDGLLSYYVIVNNLLNVISTLVLQGLLSEPVANDLVRSELISAKAATPGDPTFYDKLLTGKTLVTKGNYRTSLSNVNEASGDANGQLAAFFELPNPFSK